MIANTSKNASVLPHTAPAVTGGKAKETENKELETLKKQAEEIAAILSGSKDTVEISDEARALAKAAKNQPAPAPIEKTLDTREGRNETAKDYDAYLQDLRGKYGEEEAMRRFDAFMESEGFERVTEYSHGMRPSGGLSGMGRVFTPGLSTTGMPHLAGRQGFLTSNLNTNSSLKAAVSNGEVQYLAETHANYGANASQEVIDALSGLYQQNLESAQSETSIDLAEYMKNNFGTSPQTSVVSASTDLGAIAKNLLETAGVELGENGNVTFSMKEDGSGLYVTGAFENGEAVQNAVDAALRRNPDMLRAFKDEYNSVALSDTSKLAGAYDDGTRSVEYGEISRSFTYSAGEPSAVVMTDFVGVTVTGYNYQKKVSDSFDTEADFHTVNDGGVNIVSRDFENNQKIRREMSEAIQNALDSGEDIESTVTQEEYDAIQLARGVFDPFGGADETKLYTSSDPDAEQKAKAAEAKQALEDLESDPRFQNAEITYLDEQKELRKATASQLLELFNPARKTPALTMINSIMNFLRLG